MFLALLSRDGSMPRYRRVNNTRGSESNSGKDRLHQSSWRNIQDQPQNSSYTSDDARSGYTQQRSDSGCGLSYERSPSSAPVPPSPVSSSNAPAMHIGPS